MKKLTVIILAVVVTFVFLGVCRAEEKSLQSIDFLTGFGWGKVRVKGDYHMYPVIVDLNFDLRPLTKKINFSPRSLLQFQVEPYMAGISEPESNFETGVSFFLKAGILPETSKFQPYIKVGSGFDYMTLHTREQSTQFNFASTGGVGMHYFFKEDTAFTLEGRFRHLSNAGIDHPNSGINSVFAVAGITRKF